MNEKYQNNRENQPSTQQIRKLGLGMLRHLGVRKSEVQPVRSDAVAFEVADNRMIGNIEMGTEEGSALVDQMNNAPGTVTRDQYLPTKPQGAEGGRYLGQLTLNQAAFEMPEDSVERRDGFSVELAVDKFIIIAGQGRVESGDDLLNDATTKRYARMSGETAAPISNATAYVQANGETFYVLYGDGFHRLAAAKKRKRDKTIRATGLSVYQLSGNAFSEALAAQQ
jgi:hypothetical protein